ncbi:MAG: transglutaminase domain-containing protein [Desulfobacterales bacterium]|nr:MAG: transglutaminase domain-containing protein [Desulfobacterales bacterium]
MSLYRTKSFWILGSVFVLGFTILFMIRLGVVEKLFFRPQHLAASDITPPADKEIWMNISQNSNKIGFSHARFSTEIDGYRLQESVLMRINTMGMVQDINMKTRGRLNPDFSLADFDFEINSGRFNFKVSGSVSGEVLTVKTNSAGTDRQAVIRLKAKPYLLPAITAALAAAELNTGDRYTFDIFDPATMGQTPVIVEVMGKEEIEIMGARKSATKVALNFKGTIQLAWIDENGDVLKEKGILGIQLEKTTQEDALRDLATASSADLTQTASVPSNVMLENLDRLSTLDIEIGGIPYESVQLHGGRQTFKNNILTIEKEAMANLAAEIREDELSSLEKIFLMPGPFIQSDDQRIKNLVQEIIGSEAVALQKVRLLVDWVHQHIDKRPVLSLPDALSTLENRMGDCNEHAVLLAALARAAGIPCRIEAGLVYLKGRFYYHAWNLVYLGRWITVDAIFGQMPADVSHIRLITGSPSQQLDLMGIIGKIKLRVIQ